MSIPSLSDISPQLQWSVLANVTVHILAREARSMSYADI